MRNLAWKPIIDQIVPITVKKGKMMIFRELFNSAELVEEGNAMHHCVSTYDNLCATGQSHIFSVCAESGERISTMELRMFRKRYYINQNRGPKNLEVSDDCYKAAKKFVIMINSLVKGEL